MTDEQSSGQTLMKFKTSRNSLLSICLLLSIVITALNAPRPAYAAQSPLGPELNENKNPLTDPAPAPPTIDKDAVDRQNLEPIDIAMPPPQTPNQARQESYDYSYNFRRELSARAGEVKSTVTTNGTSTPSVVGLEISYETEHSGTYEIGADLISDGTGDLELTRNFTYGEGVLRPYARVGLNLGVDPQDQLAILVGFTILRLLGALGFALSVGQQTSVKFDFSAAFSTSSLVLTASAGLVWAW